MVPQARPWSDELQNHVKLIYNGDENTSISKTCFFVKITKAINCSQKHIRAHHQVLRSHLSHLPFSLIYSYDVNMMKSSLRKRGLDPYTNKCPLVWWTKTRVLYVQIIIDYVGMTHQIMCTSIYHLCEVVNNYLRTAATKG